MINEARSWLDTPYHHQARLKGVGVDCANLIAGIVENCGYPAVVLPPYSNEWNLHNTEEKMVYILLSHGCTKIGELKPGVIVTFQFGKVSGHAGFMVSETRLIHADLRAGKVVETELSGELLRRLSGIWELPELGASDD